MLRERAEAARGRCERLPHTSSSPGTKITDAASKTGQACTPIVARCSDNTAADGRRKRGGVTDDRASAKEKLKRKFAWEARVMEDTRLSLTARLVLVYCSHEFVRELLFSVQQETVADKLGLHVNTVANAFRAGRKLGWLALAAERKRGRGHRAADVYRLAFSGKETPTPPCGCFEGETPTSRCGCSGPNTHTESEKYPHLNGEIPTYQALNTHISGTEKRGSTGENSDPPSSYPRNTSKNYQEGVEDDNHAGTRGMDATGPPKCPRHVNDPHPPNCWACKQLREDWEKENPPPSGTDAKVSGWLNLGGADAKAAGWQALKRKWQEDRALRVVSERVYPDDYGSSP